ncbi:DUF294 nucleotidyltransferase-like domain-containing protein [Chondrinema litorale]|uniref:DUF294 nucleotidyltransferase-like domain-containing protein n=1 Tax=Chondrinema litorale TaxID=2994555 RepID=UPI00254389CF|nr:DUF294 nucleotidyltransferase-like domain-containing protein [Chondrinema litorale]UZR95466.1 DUF294 nucleotidyltransferase-like domain-containing protein [Chondrinema litorale]
MNDQLEFLKTVKPFDVLPDDVLLEVIDLLEDVYYSKEKVIYLQDESKMKGIEILVDGEFEAFFYDSGQNKRLIEKYGRGFCFGGISVLLNKKKSLRTVIAKKGTRVLFLHRNHFKALCQAYEDFFHYFTAEFGRLMLNDEYAHFVKPNTTREENFIASDQMYSRKIETIDPREVISCDSQTPIYEVARIMGEQKISCLFVKDQEEKIIGFVTDITLRDKVIAKLLDINLPILEVIDNPIVSIDDQAFVYEAILLMFQNKIRYLLIEKNGEVSGVISRNRLLSEQAQSPFVFIQSVKLALTVDELRQKWQKVPEIVFQLLNRGVKSEIVNQVITTVSDAIAFKVIETVIEEMGEPPAKFVFMVLGSEGRQEQTLKTDQDNAIIYEDKANEHREEVREYFLKFSEKVSGHLDYIGFSFCTGGFMAKNPKWTHSLSHWKRNYESWMDQSLPETVMNFSIFFDCRYIYGDETILEELKDFLYEKLDKPLDRFFYHMANIALQFEPPLTFFRNIRTFTQGSQQVFNIKKTMAPIVDLVRVYALKNKIFKTNTGERIEALREIGIFTEKQFHELMQAYYYLMGMRLKKQATQIRNDKAEPNNFIDPKSLTKIEQVTLKEVFKVIKDFQLKIKIEFTNSIFG